MLIFLRLRGIIEKRKRLCSKIDKGKKSLDESHVPMPLFRSNPRKASGDRFVHTFHHCDVIGHIRPNCSLLRLKSKFAPRTPSRKPSNPKTAHVCHHCGISSEYLDILASTASSSILKSKCPTCHESQELGLLWSLYGF